MFTNLLKTALRSLVKNKLYSFANIFGLAIGMAAALILGKYVGFSLTYNDFQKNRDKIYSVAQTEFREGSPPSPQSATYWAVGQVAGQLYPEILDFTRVTGNVETLVINHRKTEPVSFNENRILTVDSSFLKIFSFALLSGNEKSALYAPHSMVITRSAARKYFGDSDPIGQTLSTRVSWGKHAEYKVTGVLEDVPDNSTMQFDFLISSDMGAHPENYWDEASHATYFLLDDSADPPQLARKMSRDIGGHPELKSANKRIEFSLQQLGKNKLSSSERMLVMIGAFILVISWINFANLSIGRVLSRYKEAGVRKVIGAGKFQVFRQFIIEALLINGIALLIALVVTRLSTPYLSAYTNAHFLPLFNDPTPLNAIFIAMFVTGAGVSSGYPAMLLAQLNPVSALKGKYTQGRNSIRLRKTLVIIQFGISVVCTIGVFVISDQMEYIRNHDLKIDLDRTLIIKSPKDLWDGKGERLTAFKEEATSLAMVEDATSSTTIPGESYRHEVYFTYKDTTNRFMFYVNDVGGNFFELYNIRFVAGKSFQPHADAQNMRGIVLNRSAALALGFTDLKQAIGEKIVDHEKNRVLEVIGVVEDYHQLSLRDGIQPQAFCYNRYRGDISLKIDPINYSRFTDLQRCIHDLNRIWTRIYPEQPFEIYFLDAQFNAQYQEDFKFRKIFGVFATLSVFIACFGLFGLSLFISLKRTKEIGIRKIFGASSLRIVLLFTRDHVIHMAIALAVGAPVGYFLMKNWLNDYTFRTSVNGWSLILPCLFLLFISLITIGFHTIKSSLRNPITNLRDE